MGETAVGAGSFHGKAHHPRHQPLSLSTDLDAPSPWSDSGDPEFSDGRGHSGLRRRRGGGGGGPWHASDRGCIASKLLPSTDATFLSLQVFLQVIAAWQQ
ncbi:unnamed protein product [Urochloa humidicola]